MKLVLTLGAMCAWSSLMMATAMAVPPDACEQQRALYPKAWADVSNAKSLFDCSSHYSGSLRIKLGPTDPKGRILMSLVPLQRDQEEIAIEAPAKGVYRIWLDRHQVDRLRKGKYFATLVREEQACWIRGDLDKSHIFFMDRVHRPNDGAFYDKAPRISAFRGDAYTCEPRP